MQMPRSARHDNEILFFNKLLEQGDVKSPLPLLVQRH